MATETESSAEATSRLLLLGPHVIRGARPDASAAAALDAAETKAALKPRKALTENGSASYANSGNACVDFFFQVVPDTPAERVRELIAAAWAHDPLTALKVACNIGVRGTRKSHKERFYAAALWMHAEHPRTLACNVAALADFGYVKDFPELLSRLIQGPDVRKATAAAEKTRRMEDFGKQRGGLRARLVGRKRARVISAPVPTKALSATLPNTPVTTALEIEIVPDIVSEAMEVDEKKTATASRVAKLAVQSVETYYGDPAYLFLIDAVSEFFADLLASDVEHMGQRNKNRIGLAAKWCPMPGSSFDRTTGLCEAIARRLFSRESDPEYSELSEEQYTNRILDRLRRAVLEPLRKILELPVVYTSWQRRPMSCYKSQDEERFAKIGAGKLLPHEIAAPAYRGEDDAVSELQWRRMVEDLRAKGSLSKCISVCDVSGSMEQTPMEVCIALGVLTSELTEEPWAGKVMTFHTCPSIYVVNGTTLREKMEFMKRLEWHGSTNFQGVFDQILRTATEALLAPEMMVRRVFVYTDMEFDEACGRDYIAGQAYGSGSWDNDYKVICRKFRDAGYGDVVPQVIFWNLRDSKSTPVTSTQPGCTMVSGFSKNFLKIFLQNDGVVTPEAIMKEAITGDEYQKLNVFD